VYLAVTHSAAAQGFTKLAVIKHIRGFDEESREDLFFDEARLSARLNHPNVVQTNEVGEADGAHFMVMEYLEGRVFDELLSKVGHGALSRERAAPLLLYVLSEALAGLHYAHELKDFDGSPLRIVHRDVSPHNVMVTYEGQVKVLDFGIATAARRLQRTAEGMVKGKLRYMAPEQALSLPVDRRTDVFAAGVILYEIVGGAELWSGAGDVQVFRGLLDGTYPTEVTGASPDLNRMLRRALARDAGTRYATAAEFRKDLVDYLRDRGQLEDVRERLAATMQSLFAFERSSMSEIVQQHLSSTVGQPHVKPKNVGATTQPVLAADRPPDRVPVIAQDAQTQTQTVAHFRSGLPSLSDANTLPIDATTIDISPHALMDPLELETLPDLVISARVEPQSEAVRWGMPPWIQRYFLEERAARRRLVIAIACMGSAIVLGVLGALWYAAQ
jgi:serine/threonine protein kinase